MLVVDNYVNCGGGCSKVDVNFEVEVVAKRVLDVVFAWASEGEHESCLARFEVDLEGKRGKVAVEHGEDDLGGVDDELVVMHDETEGEVVSIGGVSENWVLRGVA